jgi:glutathione S-transferase
VKLYSSIGPNPRAVRMFLAEKGVEIPLEAVDLMGGENRRAPYTAKNPAGQLPCLELDDGRHLAEITAICEYLDEKYPQPPLVGETPEERAETRMWTRRIDLNIVEPLANGFRYAEGLALFKDRIRVIPQAADDLKALAQERLAWLDGLMDGNTWICGDRFTLADILLFAFLDFGRAVGQTIDPELPWLPGWFERVSKRPAAEATA